MNVLSLLVGVWLRGFRHRHGMDLYHCKHHCHITWGKFTIHYLLTFSLPFEQPYYAKRYQCGILVLQYLYTYMCISVYDVDVTNTFYTVCYSFDRLSALY